MAKKPRRESRPSHEEIALRAYHIYLTEDRAGDHSLEHWLRAEQELILQCARLKARAARAREHETRTETLRPQAIRSNPIEAWCSGLDEAEEQVRMLLRTAVLT